MKLIIIIRKFNVKSQRGYLELWPSFLFLSCKIRATIVYKGPTGKTWSLTSKVICDCLHPCEIFLTMGRSTRQHNLVLIMVEINHKPLLAPVQRFLLKIVSSYSSPESEDNYCSSSRRKKDIKGEDNIHCLSAGPMDTMCKSMTSLSASQLIA